MKKKKTIEYVNQWTMTAAMVATMATLMRQASDARKSLKRDVISALLLTASKAPADCTITDVFYNAWDVLKSYYNLVDYKKPTTVEEKDAATAYNTTWRNLKREADKCAAVVVTAMGADHVVADAIDLKACISEYMGQYDMDEAIVLYQAEHAKRAKLVQRRTEKLLEQHDRWVAERFAAERQQQIDAAVEQALADKAKKSRSRKAKK